MATIRKRGKRWEAQVRIAGQKSRSRTFESRNEALRWARGAEATGYLGAEASSVATVGDLLERYRREVTIHKRGAVQERYKLRLIQRYPLATSVAVSTTGRDIAEYRDARLKVVSGTTVRRELAILRHCFEVARKEWGLSRIDNPVGAIRYPSAGMSRTVRIPLSQEGVFWASVRASKTSYLLPIVILAIETGMRRSEILSLSWDQIDIGSSLATLPMTKNGRPRTIALSPTALDVLIELNKTSKDMLVFNVRSGALRQAWERAMLRAGIVGLRFHDLRHEAISRYFELGLSVSEVAMQSGHADLRTLFRYTHLRAENIADKIRSLRQKQA